MPITWLHSFVGETMGGSCHSIQAAERIPKMLAILAMVAASHTELEEVLRHLSRLPIAEEGSRCALSASCARQILMLASKEHRLTRSRLSCRGEVGHRSKKQKSWKAIRTWMCRGLCRRFRHWLATKTCQALLLFSIGSSSAEFL